MPEEDGFESWGVYKRLIISQLEQVATEIRTLNVKSDQIKETLSSKIDLIRSADITDLRIKIATIETEIKTKAGISGAIWGVVGAVIVGVVLHFVLK